MAKKVLVTLSDVVWNTIKKDQKFKIADSDADAVKSIILAYLEGKSTEEITKELATHEIMIATLVQELSSKGVISFQDWENKVKEQVE